jgi:hypothetical protein
MLETSTRVVILPTEKEAARIGIINKSVCRTVLFNKNYAEIELYEIDGMTYARKELLAVGDTIDIYFETTTGVCTNTCNIITDDIIELNSTVIPVGALKFKESGYYIDWKVVNNTNVTPVTQNIDSKYKAGWIDCFKEFLEYFKDDSSSYSLLDRVEKELDGNIWDFDPLEAFDKRNELITKVALPQLTLEEIKEKLGFDFELKK